MIELEFSTRETKWSKCDSSLRYIHQAGKIDGKTTRCKSRNQRARLENCPNTEFLTSSVTKFLFFFFQRREDIFDAEEAARFEYFIFLSLKKFRGRGMTTHASTLLFISPRFSILPDGFLFYFCEFTILTLIRWNKNRFENPIFEMGYLMFNHLREYSLFLEKL